MYAQCVLNYPSSVTACPNANYTLLPSQANTGVTSYSWTGSGGVSIVSGDNTDRPVISATSAGQLTLNAAGCTPATRTISITVMGQPSIQVSPSQPVCSGGNISAQVTNPQAGVIYNWTFPGGATATGTSATLPVRVPPGNGTHAATVTLSATLNGTTCTYTRSVDVKQGPDLRFTDEYNSPGFANCNGNNQFQFILTNSSSTAASNTQYQVVWGDGQSQSFTGSTWPANGELNHAYNGLGNFPLQVTVTGSNGCTAVFSQTVFNGSNPASGITNPGGTLNMCTGNSTVTFPFGSSVFANTPGTLYKIWVNDHTDTTVITHPGPPQTLQPSYTHSFQSSSCSVGEFIVYMLAINGCNMNPTPSTQPNITVYEKPQTDFDVPAQACVNVPFTITNTTTGGQQLTGGSCGNPFLKWEIVSPAGQWTLASGQAGNGFPPPNNIPTGSQQLSVRFSQAGIHRIRLIARNAICGNDTIEKTICIQEPAQSVTGVSATSGCSPLPVNTTNNSTGNAVCGTLSHQWTVNPASGWSFTGGTNTQSPAPRFSFTAPGTYTLTHTVTNGCGPSESVHTITVVSPPTVTINPVTPDCAPASLSPTATINAGGGTISSYSWTFPGGSPSSAGTANPGTIGYAAPGTSNIQLSVSNECGSASDSRSITIPAPPSAPLITHNSPVCSGDTAQFRITAPTAGITYQWTGPGSFSQTGDSISIPGIQVSQAGSYSVTARVGSCVSPPASVDYSVTTAPVILINPSSPAVCPGDSVILTASGASSYSWSPATGLNTTSGATVVASPSAATTYTVSGNQPGISCPGTTTVNLNLHTPPAITFSDPLLTLCNQPVATLISGYTPFDTVNGAWSATGNIQLTPGGSVTPLANGSFTARFSYTDPLTGCSANDSITMLVEAPQVPDVDSLLKVCSSPDTIQLSPSAGSWTIENVPLPGGRYLPDRTGSFTAVYTTGQGSCAVSDTMTITVHPVPGLMVAPPAGICSGQTDATLSGSSPHADVLTWFIAGMQTPAGNGNTLTVAPSQTTDYALRALISATGCTTTDTVTLTVSPTPQAAFSVGPEFCSTSAIRASNNSSPTGAVFSWELNGPVNAILTGNEPDLTTLTTGNYTLRLVASVGSCSDTSDVHPFEVFEPPVVNITTPPVNSCQNNQIPVQATVSGPENNYSYAWTFGNFLISSQPQPGPVDFPAPALNDTSIVYSLQVTGALCGAVTATAQQQISVRPSVRFITDEANGCSIFRLPTPVEYHGNPATVELQLENGFTTTNLDHVFSFSAPQQPQSYRVFVTAENACGAHRDTMRVNVIPNPVIPAIISNLPLQGACAGAFASFASISTGSADSLLGYRWAVDNMVITAGAPAFNYLFDRPGTYRVSLNVADGCSDSTVTIPVTVLPQPGVEPFLLPETACVNQSLQLSANANDAVYYQWFTGDGQAYHSQETRFSYPAAGTYTISIQVSDATGSCTATREAEIEIYPVPDVKAFIDIPGMCEDSWLKFSSTSAGATSFNWDFGNSAHSVQPDDSTYYTAPGSYTAMLTAFNFAGCSARDSVNVLIYPKPVSRPVIEVPAGSPLCGPLVSIQPENRSQGAFAYQWYINGEYVSNLFAPRLELNGYGTRVIQLIARTTFGCADTAETDVEVFPLPEMHITAIPGDGCAPFTAELTPLCPGCTEIKIQSQGTIITQPLHTWEHSGTYPVLLVGRTAAGCRDTVYTEVTVHPRPKAAFTVEPKIMKSYSETFYFTNQSVPEEGLTYEMLLNDSSIAAGNKFLPSHSLNLPGYPDGYLSYTLVTTTDKGCSDTTTQTILVQQGHTLYIPEAFTPNGDGLNDTFLVRGTHLKNVRLRIFDRWGEIIYASGTGTDIEQLNGWDGNYRGTLCPDGVYLYLIYYEEPGGSGRVRHGRLLLISHTGKEKGAK